MTTANNNLTDKLDYIGLNLDKIPKFITEVVPLNYKSSPMMNDNEHKIFKYIPIHEIQILISPTNRLTDIKEKYSKARPLADYVEQKNIEEYATFLNMLNTATIEGMEEVEARQKKLNKKIPFGVQYDKDYTWQIYYAENVDQYFMLVTTEDYNYDCFFYLLKEQIKYHKSRKKAKKLIFAPVNLLGYSTELLTNPEVSDLENYLWLFTKDWPNIYEVYDKDDQNSIQIIGNTVVYKTIKSGYRVALENREEALKFYKVLKALFILQTELPMYYKFEPHVKEDCSLDLYYQLDPIQYEHLSEFIRDEYLKVEHQILKEKETVENLEKQLEELKQISALRDIEYLNKQKEIAMYLEYKKTFFGKIKLFIKFKNKKNTKLNLNIKKHETVTPEKKIEQPDHDIQIPEENEREFYTIEDLVTLYHKLEKELTYVKNMKSDIRALELKVKNMDKKIENATQYIAEIENHKKSIFEFWKFVNKDEILAMEEGSLQANETKQHALRKVFDYESDMQDLGVQMDTEQRKSIPKEAQDSLFLANTPEILSCINHIKDNMEIDYNYLRDVLKKMKKLAESKKATFRIEEFDIFGGMSDHSNHTKTLANKKHRETEKDALRILNIGKNTDVEEFKARLEKAEQAIAESVAKIKSPYDMSIYVVKQIQEPIDKKGYSIYHIIPDDAIKSANLAKIDKCNLYKLNIKENMPLVFYTNILYFDNYNETLPVGMNVTDQVILDGSKFNFIPKNMATFHMTGDFEENEVMDPPAVKNMMVCEYDLEYKGDQQEEKQETKKNEKNNFSETEKEQKEKEKEKDE